MYPIGAYSNTITLLLMLQTRKELALNLVCPLSNAVLHLGLLRF